MADLNCLSVSEGHDCRSTAGEFSHNRTLVNIYKGWPFCKLTGSPHLLLSHIHVHRTGAASPRVSTKYAGLLLSYTLKTRGHVTASWMFTFEVTTNSAYLIIFFLYITWVYIWYIVWYNWIRWNDLFYNYGIYCISICC